MTKKGYRQTKEHREKISKSRKGIEPWNKNKKGGQTAWNKDLKTGSLSEETKRKISKTKIGTLCSEKTKQKMRDSKKGKNNPNYGKHLSEEVKQKLRDKNIGKHLSDETKRKLCKFTKEEELQICKEYFSKEKLCTNTLAEKWSCGNSTISSIIRRNGFLLRTHKKLMKDPKEKQKISIANSTPEAIQKALKNGYGTNCYYNNEFFPSLQERDCYIKLKKLGFKIKHNFLNRFDFLINDKVVVEFHPFDFKLTDKQYYTQRRKLLDEYGHKDLKLIVIKDLKEIKNIFR